MTTPSASSDLIRWAAQAGYSLIPKDKSDAAVFWKDPGGEIRYYLRTSQDGTVVLTSAERNSAEQIELVGVSLLVVERYLFGLFGTAYRSAHGLPRLVTPRGAHQAASGYRVGDMDDDGYRSLSDSAGMVAQARGKLSSISDLLTLSHLLSASPEALIASFRSADGSPVFSAK